MTPTFEGDILNGKLKLQPQVKAAISRWLLTFKTGAHVEIIIRKFRNKTTKKQYGYYWSTVVPILADYFGHDKKEDMHEDLKSKFNPIKSKIDPSKTIGGTTTELFTDEFYGDEKGYVDKICRWAAQEYGIYIPPPKECG